MKSLKVTIIFLASCLGSLASAQNWNQIRGAELTCIYQAQSSYHGLQTVVLTFRQDSWGRPTGGWIQIQRPNGSEAHVGIPAKDIRQMSAGPLYGAELVANIHVRSFDVDLVLNYVGNDLRNDAEYLMNSWNASVQDMIQAYAHLMSRGGIRHRTQNPMAQMTGSVRGQDGQITKLASSQFACSLN